jgi:hypothetical protein
VEAHIAKIQSSIGFSRYASQVAGIASFGRAERVPYRVSSWVFGRALGGVVLIAFASLGVQAKGLFGAHGVMPVAMLVESAKRAEHSFWHHPSALWWSSSDAMITTLWITGVIAGAALLLGLLPKLALAISWFSYLSFVSLGWPFMSFQWDTLLLEVTFTAFFFVPWTALDRLRTHPDPHPLARWALWWLLFRLIFRSGYVKLASGDSTWADLTALTYHYWTQPLPTVLAWYANLLPTWLDRLACLLMFVIELGVPFLIWIPRLWARRSAAAAIAGLMILIALTGSYGFFNLLTIALCVPLLDDRLMTRLVPARFVPEPSSAHEPESTWNVRPGIAPALIIALTAVIFFTGTFTERFPRWLAPLYPFSTFNNYGLFAVMTTERPEINLEGTRDGKTWEPYVFRYKPGPLDRAPVWAAPHQPRLDWQMWFAALGDYHRNIWLGNLMRRLLEGEPTVIALLETSPFADEPPKQIRAIIYRYRFSTPEERNATGRWWERSDRELYAPILGEPIEPVSTEEKTIPRPNR